MARLGSLKKMVRGCEHFLYDQEGTRYLDFLSQYGVISFGHNHPELVAALQECLAAQQPSMIQPFTAPATQELAEKLEQETPGNLCYTVFTNSGAESTEAAIKLARARTGRLTILSTLGGFHGKTLGALSATGNPAYQTPFGAPSPHFEYIPFGDPSALEAKLKSDGDNIAAFIVEPVQGEGGMIPAPPGYLAAVVELCRAAGVVTIFDEVQTGLGRTGALFAAGANGTVPDIMLLGKALGGGLMPIGACICGPDVWDHTFGRMHSSTFAGNQLACVVGSKVIDLLVRDKQKLVKTVAENGKYLLGRLTELAARHPDVIKDVRGSGLMAGIEFHRFDGNDSYTMGFISSNGLLTPLLSGFLLNTHKIVTASVFNDSHFVRLEPPFTVGHTEIDETIDAIDALCDSIENKDYCHILKYLTDVGELPRPAGCFMTAGPGRHVRPAQAREAKTGSFAFLVHYATDQDYLRIDPSFRNFTPGEFDRWQRWLADVGPGVIDHVEQIPSATGHGAEGWLIGVPMLPRQLLEMRPPEMLDVFGRVIQLAKAQGAGILGLGGFTSVVTRGGQRVVGQGIAVTTGNCLTSVMAVDGIRKAAEARELNLCDLHVAVVGATGAIGRLSALMLADKAARITLVGNGLHPDSERRCRAVAGDLYCHLLRCAAERGASSREQAGAMAPIAAMVVQAVIDLQGASQSSGGNGVGRWVRQHVAGDDTEDMVELTATLTRAFEAAGLEPPLRCSCDLDSSLKDADVVLVVTSSDQPLIHAGHLKHGAIVCDVARPSNVAAEVANQRSDVMVFEGGLVELPHPVQFGANLQLLPPGTSLGCLAEAALLAIEGDYSDHSIGQRLDLAEAQYLRKLAEKHGFRAASPQLSHKP